MRTVELNTVTKYYGQSKILNELSFSLERGDVVGLIGPNGGGKTTLIKIIAGQLPFDSGTGTTCGVTLGRGRAPFCGLMLDNSPFIDDMTGKQNLKALCGIRKKATSSDICTTLHETGLDPALKHRVHTYSQGMRQRLAFAQAIVENPTLLLFDEPLNGLDPTGILDVRSLIRRFAKQGTSILFSSHILAELPEVCNRVCALVNGKIVELSPREFSDYHALEDTYRRITGYCDE